MQHGRYDDDYGDSLFQFLYENGLHVRRGCGYSNLDMSVKLVPPLELQALQAGLLHDRRRVGNCFLTPFRVSSSDRGAIGSTLPPRFRDLTGWQEQDEKIRVAVESPPQSVATCFSPASGSP